MNWRSALGLVLLLAACHSPTSSPAKHSIRYDANGATSGVVPTDANRYPKGAHVAVESNPGNLVKTGSVFAGWNTKPDGYGDTYVPGSQITFASSNITLYALWSGLYTVSYDANGAQGTVPADTSTYIEGAAVTILDNTGGLIRGSETFAGWNTQPDGSGTTYTPGATMTMGRSNVILYSLWSPSFTVAYFANFIATPSSGAVPVDTNTYVHSSLVTVLGNPGGLEVYGYTFVGWNTKADGTGTLYAGGSAFPVAWANVQLYATWTKDPTYSVVYDASGASGTVPTDANHYLASETVTVMGNPGGLIKSGYGLAGWSTQAGGAGTLYTPGSTFFMGTQSVTLYADWHTAYTIAFNSNSADQGAVPASQVGIASALLTVPGNTGALTRAGYVFGGWNTQSNGSGTTYLAGSTLTIPAANMTLYALWLPLYSVSYDANGGTGTVPQGGSFLNGTSVTVLANTGPVSRTGYVFAGWNTRADGTGATYQAGASFVMGSGAVVLYALWTPLLNVIYNANGATSGSVPVDSQTYLPYTSATVFGNIGNLSKTGYQFAGWNTKPDGSGTTYSTNQSVSLGTVNFNLYVLWTPTYTVTYFGNGASGGTVPVDSGAYVAGGAAAVLGNSGTLTLTGKQLVGWNTSADGSGTSWAVGAVMTMGSANRALYAIWAPAGLTFTASGNTITVTGYTSAPTGTLVLPAGITSIAANALANSTAMTSVSIPATVTSIGSGAFAFCDSLTAIQVAAGNPNYQSDGSGVLLDAAGTSLLQAPGGLAGTYAVPAGVHSIMADAFEDCTHLTGVTVPEDLSSIGSGAFDGCSSLVSATLPSTLTNLGNGAFFDCSALTGVVVLAVSPPALSATSQAFMGTNANLVITVPSGSVTAYQAAVGWNAYAAKIGGN